MTAGDLDYRALSDPVDQATFRKFRRQIRATDPTAYRSQIAVATTRMIFVAIIGIAAAAFAIALMTVFIDHVADGTFTPPNLALVLLSAGAIGAYLVFVTRSLNSGNQSQVLRWFRMSRFAADNDLQFTPLATSVDYPGMLFHLGQSTTIIDRLTTRTGQFVDMGDVQSGSAIKGKGLDLEWGFLALRLERQLPNIILESRANRSIPGMGLPIAPDAHQRLSLEGDFDRHFTLYCPREYEADALRILTPDVMQLLIEQSTAFDIEIIDDWLFVYSPQPLNFSDRATVHHLFTIVDTIGAKTLKQTRRYGDPAGSPDADVVAAPGRRLVRAPILAGLGTAVVAGIIYLVILIVHVVNT